MDEFLKAIKSYEFEFIIERKPENYVRERYSGKNKKFYNKKASIMTEYKNLFKGQIKKFNKFEEFFQKIKDPDEKYNVELDIEYYLQIPVGAY